jgi:hypothetical protein
LSKLSVQERAKLDNDGFYVKPLSNLEVAPRRVYYRADGTKTLPLPSDAKNMQDYLAKGFTLEPPQAKREEPTVAVEVVPAVPTVASNAPVSNPTETVRVAQPEPVVLQPKGIRGRFTCSKCGEGFGTVSSLILHRKEKHLGAKK